MGFYRRLPIELAGNTEKIGVHPILPGRVERDRLRASCYKLEMTGELIWSVAGLQRKWTIEV
jgi:hypothetical protein